MDFSWPSVARTLPRPIGTTARPLLLCFLLLAPLNHAPAQALSFGEIRPFVVGLVPVVGRGAVGGVSIDSRGVVSRSDVESLGRLRDMALKALEPIDSGLQVRSPLRKI